jgi:hypothetical protein
MRRAVATVPLAGAYARIGERDTSLDIARQAVSLIGILNASVMDNQLVKYIRQDLLEVFPRDPLVQKFIADVRNQLPQMEVGVSS